SWRDSLHEQLVAHFGEEKGNELQMIYNRAFPVNYQETFSPQEAVLDIEKIEKLSKNNPLEMNLYHQADTQNERIHFKLFHANETIPLSDAIPILEKMGLRVIGEQPYQIQFKKGHAVWINDFNMHYLGGRLEMDKIREIFQTSFKKIWTGEV